MTKMNWVMIGIAAAGVLVGIMKVRSATVERKVKEAELKAAQKRDW